MRGAGFWSEPKKISGDDGAIEMKDFASPSELEKRIEALRFKIQHYEVEMEKWRNGEEGSDSEEEHWDDEVLWEITWLCLNCQLGALQGRAYATEEENKNTVRVSP